jgi:hypothetical protein
MLFFLMIHPIPGGYELHGIIWHLILYYHRDLYANLNFPTSEVLLLNMFPFETHMKMFSLSQCDLPIYILYTYLS